MPNSVNNLSRDSGNIIPGACIIITVKTNNTPYVYLTRAFNKLSGQVIPFKRNLISQGYKGRTFINFWILDEFNIHEDEKMTIFQRQKLVWLPGMKCVEPTS